MFGCLNSIACSSLLRTVSNQFNKPSLLLRCCSTSEALKPSNVKKLLDEAATFESDTNVDNLWSTSPYPKGVNNKRRLQSRHSLKPRVDPSETSLILFPGEGSQYVGMGKNLLHFPGARDIFDAASDILKYDILSLCLKGPKPKLDETKYAQVAVLVCSFAALDKLKEERPTSVDSCFATAGFGVGELTALTFSGAISFERAIRLAQFRAEAMEVASEMEPSGLMTVMYRAETRFHEILERAVDHAARAGVENPVCEVANYLFPHCKVIGGHNECLQYVEKNYKALRLDKVRRLNIKGAHNTRLMQPAAQTFKQLLLKSNIKDPLISVHSCVDGKMYNNIEDIFRKLPQQIWKPIRWEQMMHVLYERKHGDHFPHTFECGPGTTLKTLLKMVNAKASDTCDCIFD